MSVVVPSYNHAQFLRAALESVFRQSYRNIELIVIDDGSRDGSPQLTREILGECPFSHRFTARENRGAPVTLNEAIRQSTGDYVNVLNSDDCFEPTRIEEMVEAVAATDADWGFSAVSCIDASGVPGQRTPRMRAPPGSPGQGTSSAKVTRSVRHSWARAMSPSPPAIFSFPGNSSTSSTDSATIGTTTTGISACGRSGAPSPAIVPRSAVPLPRPCEQHHQGTEPRDPAGSFEHAVRLPFGRVDPAADQSAGAVPPQPRHSLRRPPPCDGRR